MFFFFVLVILVLETITVLGTITVLVMLPCGPFTVQISCCVGSVGRNFIADLWSWSWMHVVRHGRGDSAFGVFGMHAK